MKVRIPKIVPAAPAWAETFGVDLFGVFAGIRVAGVSQMLRWIEPCGPGEFLMGSPENERGRWKDEGPQHEVTIASGFWLGDTLVTQEFFQAVAGTNPSVFKGEGRLPVESVSWNDAVEFCGKLDQLLLEGEDSQARLPTEAEWEYACRAGTTAALYSGEELTSEDGKCPNLDKLAWYDKNSQSKTHAVAEKQPNAWGLYDMLGNVWEWCQDVWQDNYIGAPTDGSAWESEGTIRVSRGGSWAGDARYCRCACRYGWEPGGRARYAGFRLVLAARFNRDIRSFS